MEICGEHGDEIAFAGRDCPACDHLDKVCADLKEEHESEVSDLQSVIDDLDNKLSEVE